MAKGTHMPCGITQCYLPPGRGDILAFTLAEANTQFSDPGGMQGWVNLSTAVSAQPVAKDLFAVAVAINTTIRAEIRIWVLSHRSQTR